MIQRDHGDKKRNASILAINDLVKAKHWGGKIEVGLMNNVIKGMLSTGTLKPGIEIDWNDVLDMNFLPEDHRLNSLTKERK